MKSFISSTYYLWVVLRILFIVAGLISLFQILSEERLDFVESFINLIFFIYLILMIICSVRDIKGIKSRNLLNRITGVISILIGISILAVVFIFSGSLIVPVIVPLLFIIFCFLIGMFDILGPERAESLESLDV